MLPELTRRWVIPTTGALTLAGAGCDSGQVTISEPATVVDTGTALEPAGIVGEWAASEWTHGNSTVYLPSIGEYGSTTAVNQFLMRVEPQGRVRFGPVQHVYEYEVFQYTLSFAYGGSASPNGDGSFEVAIPRYGELVMTCTPTVSTMTCDGFASQSMLEMGGVFDRE